MKPHDHDPLCPAQPQDGAHPDWCRCELILRVRSEEKAIFQGIWKANLRKIEVRNYERGYNDRAKGAESRP